MSDVFYYLCLALTFLGTFVLVGRLVRFLLIIFFDRTVTVRYFHASGDVSLKKVKIKTDRELASAINQIREESSKGAST